ncbi:tRNA (adenosine(37)-N6)-dimethylallyltransferase MiaA [Erysipelotrichaceae bacterium 51-3]
MSEKKVIAIVGPTASGKSSLAIEAAKALNGEIISADSMQVYEGMDIGTAKIAPAEMEGIPHHLIDIQPIDQPWNVRTFQQLCRQAIDEITAKGKVPILCGGTGLYVKAALYDYEFAQEQDEQISEKQAELEKLTNEQLVDLLKDKDPQALEKIHPNNRKRLLRAALMVKNGKTKSERENAQEHAPIYTLYIVGLKDERAKEIERINLRVDQMFDAGLPEEVKRLFQTDASRKWNSFQGIGYKEFAGWLDGLQSLDEVRELIKIHTRQYARRQMTWFNHQMPVHWYQPADRKRIVQDLEEWYGRK